MYFQFSLINCRVYLILIFCCCCSYIYAMASVNLEEKANYTRLSRLLLDKGTEALRITLDTIHAPANLYVALKANRTSLLKLKPRVINDNQWDLLFPPCGSPPDSKSFDVTLLNVLLRNICGLSPPATGWNTMPPHTDGSLEANVTRIKLFRNEVYAHVASTQVDKARFDSLWQTISKALVDLSIPQKEIDDLKTCPLGPEEEIYVQSLKDWFIREEDSKRILDDLTTSIKSMQKQLTQSNVQQQDDRDTFNTSMQHFAQITEESRQGIQQLYQFSSMQSEVKRPRGDSEESKIGEKHSNSVEVQLLQTLAKHNFKSKIRSKVKLFHPDTRNWLFKKVENWFTTEDESRLLLITAGPGFGKSVFSAKVCEVFRKRRKLAGCHFCDFSIPNLKDPKMMLQSLASQMCENVPGFKKELLDQLNRPHIVQSLSDAFQIYLQNPLDELEDEPRLIVIDGLDESKTDNKSEMVKLMADHFPDLPKCVKVMVTSRPGLYIERLSQIEMIKIGSNSQENELDLLEYLKVYLPTLAAKDDAVDLSTKDLHSQNCRFKVLPVIVEKCEGSFLYASHVQDELRKREDLDTMTFEEIIAFLPKGMGSVYHTYFHRLEIELEEIMKKKADLYKLLELLVADKKVFLLEFIARALDLDLDCRKTKRIIDKVNEAVSCLLFVSNGIVTVFHKSVHDWLLESGYDYHEYTVNVSDGKKRLWLICEQIFEEVKKKVSSEFELKLANDVKHALEYGYDYLLKSNMWDSLFWLVDMVIVHVQTAVHPKNTSDILCVLSEVLHSDVKTSLELRQRISWHLFEVSSMDKFNQHFSYLESVLARSPEGLFTDDEKHIAKVLVAKAPPCVRRISVGTKTVSLPLAKLFLSAISAVGASSNKKLTAVALEDGTICVLSLPELVLLWQYSSKNEDISCCTFTPDDSSVLYGKLETALNIAEKKELSFWKGEDVKGVTFKSCAFSPSGNRLVTNDGSSTVKLWNVSGQCLLAGLCAEDCLDFCGFSNTGLFIIADEKNAEEDAYCVWNAITFQRVDQRSLFVSKLKKLGGVPKSERCNHCACQQYRELFPSKKLEISPCEQLNRRGIYNGMDCIFYLYSQSLRVIECTHFTTLAAWEIFIRIDGHFTIVDITAIEDDLWLYADETKLTVFRTARPKEDQSCLSLPTRVVWCSFSPNGTRLASCTLDGFINMWNVDTCQMYQRFRDNVGTSEVACWWSDQYLFVCHIFDDILSLSKYPVDENFKIMITQGQLVEICTLKRFSSISRVLDFSEGYLLVSCRMDSIKVYDVNRIEHVRPLDVLPGYEPAMSIIVSVGASFVLGYSDKRIILWKRSETHSTVYTVYEVFFYHDLETKIYNRLCCFSNDLKYAVICYTMSQKRRYAVINLDTRKMVTDDIQVVDAPDDMSTNVMKVFSTDTVVIVVSPYLIEIFDLGTWKRLAFYHNDNLNISYLCRSKLSPNGSVLAVPDSFGDMEFFQLRIPKCSSVRNRLKRL